MVQFWEKSKGWWISVLVCQVLDVWHSYLLTRKTISLSQGWHNMLPIFWSLAMSVDDAKRQTLTLTTARLLEISQAWRKNTFLAKTNRQMIILNKIVDKKNFSKKIKTTSARKNKPKLIEADSYIFDNSIFSVERTCPVPILTRS